jgi:hypothetical protein
MGALGKEAKLFQATTQMININDKKLETMGSFNLTMNAVPITTNPAEEVKSVSHLMQHVKEEQLEEEEEDMKAKKRYSGNETDASTNLDAS